MENKILFSVDKVEIVGYPEAPYKEEKDYDPIIIRTEGEDCDKEYGDICETRRCHYAVLNMRNGEKIWFTCGRRKDEVKW